MDYYLKEVNNYTLTVGDRNFIVHDPLLDIMPNIRLLKTQQHFDLNDLLLVPYVEAIKTRFENDIVVYDENGEPSFNEPLILRLLGESFDTLYRLLYNVNDVLPFNKDDEEFHLKIETLFWLIDFLGLTKKILSFSTVDTILDDEELISGTIKQQELEEVAGILGWSSEQGIIDIYALASILDDSEVLNVMEELKNIGYFTLAAFINTYYDTTMVLEGENSFSEIFYNVNIENYYIISKDGDRIVIHSPVEQCNFYIQKHKEIFIDQSPVIIELALSILYRLLHRTPQKMFIHILEKLKVTKENVGQIYFIFKQLSVFPLFNIGENVAEYFLIDHDINLEAPKQLVATSALLRSAAVRSDVKYLDSAIFTSINLRGRVAPFVSYIVDLLIEHNKYHKAAMYDCFSGLINVLFYNEDEDEEIIVDN